MSTAAEQKQTDASADRVAATRAELHLPPLTAGHVLELSGAGESAELWRVNQLRALSHLPPRKTLETAAK